MKKWRSIGKTFTALSIMLSANFNRPSRAKPKRPEVTCQMSRQEIAREMSSNRHPGYHYNNLGV